jgi:hypothetical protein
MKSIIFGLFFLFAAGPTLAAGLAQQADREVVMSVWLNAANMATLTKRVCDEPMLSTIAPADRAKWHRADFMINSRIVRACWTPVMKDGDWVADFVFEDLSKSAMPIDAFTPSTR